MANFFDSQASNYLVGIAAKISKTEKSIIKEHNSESLLILYNSIQEAAQTIENAIAEIETKKTFTEAK